MGYSTFNTVQHTYKPHKATTTLKGPQSHTDTFAQIHDIYQLFWAKPFDMYMSYS